VKAIKDVIGRIALVSCAIIISSSFAGCDRSSSAGLNAEKILADTLAAMENVETCNLDTYLVGKNIFIGKSVDGFLEDTWQWISERQVDATRQKLHLELRIKPIVASSKNPYMMESYVDDGWYYTRATLEPGNTIAKWGRGRLDNIPEMRWESLSQMGPVLALLKESSVSGPVQEGSFRGTDCFMLDAMPSPESSANWIMSQELYYGPSFAWMDALFPDSIAAYIRTFKSGNIRFYIAKDSYQVLKMNIDLLFEGVPGVSIGTNFGTPQRPDETPDPGIDHMIRDFSGEWEFSGYNQPVKLDLPPDYFDIAERQG
jgi:hypothetical protein